MFWFMQKKFVESYLAFNDVAVVFVAIGGLEPVVVPIVHHEIHLAAQPNRMHSSA
jgi:hypothetical protein